MSKLTLSQWIDSNPQQNIALLESDEKNVPYHLRSMRNHVVYWIRDNDELIMSSGPYGSKGNNANKELYCVFYGRAYLRLLERMESHLKALASSAYRTLEDCKNITRLASFIEPLELQPEVNALLLSINPNMSLQPMREAIAELDYDMFFRDSCRPLMHVTKITNILKKKLYALATGLDESKLPVLHTELVLKHMPMYTIQRFKNPEQGIGYAAMLIRDTIGMSAIHKYVEGGGYEEAIYPNETAVTGMYNDDTYREQQHMLNAMRRKAFGFRVTSLNDLERHHDQVSDWYMRVDTKMHPMSHKTYEYDGRFKAIVEKHGWRLPENGDALRLAGRRLRNCLGTYVIRQGRSDDEYNPYIVRVVFSPDGAGAAELNFGPDEENFSIKTASIVQCNGFANKPYPKTGLNEILEDLRNQPWDVLHVRI
jgi:hypothetical protein